MSPFQLLDAIPVELLAYILSSLDCVALLRCRQVCKSLDTLISSMGNLQLIIELHAAGQEMEPDSKVSPSARLELLRKRNAAWDGLKFTEDHRIPMLGGNLWELCGGVLAQSTVEKSITFRRLPSLCRSIEEVEWTLDNLGFLVRDFGMDPSQDLLVMVEPPRRSNTPCRVHLRSLSTGHNHPMAQTPTIECHSAKVADARASLTIQASGDHLGILFCYSDGPENEFYIWEWKTGAVKTVISGDEMESFVFMSEREVIFGVLGPSDDDDLEVSLLVLDFEEESKESHAITEIEHGISFLFPIIEDRIGVVTLEVHSDPAPTLARPSRFQLPFFVAPHNRIFTASLSIIHDGRLKTIMLVAPLATFRSSLDRRIDTRRKKIPWSFWGPKGTRMLMPDRNPSDVWVCYVNASKYVALRKMRRNGATTILVDVFDFHQPGLSRALSDPDHRTDCVTSTNCFKAGDVFGEEVQTSLPYRLRTLPLDSTYTSDMGVMCGEDHIIIVDAHVEHREYRILSF